jgi:hypothetical protein
MLPFHNLFRVPWYRRCDSRGPGARHAICLAAQHMSGYYAHLGPVKERSIDFFFQNDLRGGRMRVLTDHVKPARISSKNVATVLYHSAQR